MMKSILFVTNSIAINDVIGALAEKYLVHVIYFYSSTSIKRKRFTKVNYYPIVSKSSKALSLSGSFFDIIGLIPIFLIQFIKIIYLVFTQDIRLINAHWAIPTGFFSCLASKVFQVFTGKKIPVVVTVHGSDIHTFWNKPLFNQLVTFTLVNSDLIICVSADLKARIKSRLSYNKIKMVVIPVGVDTSLFYPRDKRKMRTELKLPSDSKILIYVGSLFPIKQVDKIIYAVSKLRQNVTLLIIGDGSEKTSLMDYSNKLGLENIIFMGRIDNELVPFYLSASDLLIQYSKLEGSPICIQEALACGLPVVAKNVGGVSELVYDNINGFLVENIKDMIVKIDDFFKCTDLAVRFSKNARTHAITSLSNSVITRKYTAIFEKIIKIF